MHTTSYNRGFTLTELLIVIFVIGVIAAIAVVSFKDFITRQSLRVTGQDVYSALIDARADTLASKDDTVYGIHIGTTEVIRFTGASYDPNAMTNATTTLLPPVTATTSLSGGATDIVFSRLTGEASATGTLTLFADGEGTTTITIHASGLIEKAL